MLRNYLVECLGTFFLVLTVGLSGGNALAIGSALMVMVYFGGHLSGGHYNPAVTLAVWARGRLSVMQIMPYWLSQIGGAFLAALTFFFLRGETFAPHPTVAPWAAVVAEALYTFALCSVVLAVATTDKLKGNQIYGLAIGFTVLVGVSSIGSMTGAALNPAVATGPIAWKMFLMGKGASHLWVYWVGPLSGGAFSALVYRVLYR